MGAYIVTEEKLIAWTSSTDEGREAFQEAHGYPDGEYTLEDYFADYGNDEYLLYNVAYELGYPGDELFKG